jgi:hypothetical protein
MIYCCKYILSTHYLKTMQTICQILQHLPRPCPLTDTRVGRTNDDFIIPLDPDDIS